MQVLAADRGGHNNAEWIELPYGPIETFNLHFFPLRDGIFVLLRPLLCHIGQHKEVLLHPEWPDSKIVFHWETAHSNQAKSMHPTRVPLAHLPGLNATKTSRNR
jgi:hypothetical protein